MKSMMKIVVAALFCGALAGCGGGDTYVRVQGTTTISKGQELSDLQRALKEGAITQREYDQLHRKILARPN
jgi:uncharacterized lipoprotein